MLIRFLHWLAKDVLPDRLWTRWLRWRYQRENRPESGRADPMETQRAIYNYRQEKSRLWHSVVGDMKAAHDADHDHSFVAYPSHPAPPTNCLICGWSPLSQDRFLASVKRERRGFAQQAEVYDCGCPVQRTMAGDPARQFHSEGCQHFSPYRKGGIIKVDRHLIPHRPGRGICDCAACNPSGAIFSC